MPAVSIMRLFKKSKGAKITQPVVDSISPPPKPNNRTSVGDDDDDDDDDNNIPSTNESRRMPDSLVDVKKALNLSVISETTAPLSSLDFSVSSRSIPSVVSASGASGYSSQSGSDRDNDDNNSNYYQRNIKSKYGYGDDTAWGSFGFCDEDSSPHRSSNNSNNNNNRETTRRDKSSNRSVRSNDDNDIIKKPSSGRRVNRRRASMQFGTSITNEGDLSSSCSSLDTSSWHENNNDSPSSPDASLKQRKKKKGKKVKRRSSIAVTSSSYYIRDSSPSVTQACVTQYSHGDEAPWKTFGYSEPYTGAKVAAVAEAEFSKTIDNQNHDEDQYTLMSTATTNASPEDIAKYGYGDDTPTARATNEYEKYGYGNASPEVQAKYEYGDASPDDYLPNPIKQYTSPFPSNRKGASKTLRRTSMKHHSRSTNNEHRERNQDSCRQRRRASIQFGSKADPSVMKSPTREHGKQRVKRRSSMAATLPSIECNYGDETPWGTFGCVDAVLPATREIEPKDNRNRRYNNNDYGYEDATPDSDTKAKYGYEDATPDSDDKDKYGYGNAAPDSEAKDKYGYEDATPDSEAKDKYGYGDATPDSEARDKYGYGDTTPDSEAKDKYGYGDAAPDSDTKKKHGDGMAGMNTYESGSSHRRAPRRSSMKQSGHPRRASIQFGGEIEVSLPQGTTVKRRTSITFNELTDVRQVAPAKELAADPDALWLQAEDLRRIKEKAMAVAERVHNNGGNCRALTGKYCVRGLEKYIGSTRHIVMGRKYEAWESVLDEQHLQRCSGEYDQNHIANVYRYATMETQKEANARGLKDAAEIEQYLSATRRMCRRMSM